MACAGGTLWSYVVMLLGCHCPRFLMRAGAVGPRSLIFQHLNRKRRLLTLNEMRNEPHKMDGGGSV